jgi:tetratricopeptide (TPR) repeat protein
MDYERGLTELKSELQKNCPERLDEFNNLEGRLLDNLGREEAHGSTETIRAERAAIVDGLNQLAQTCLGVSFNGLCAEPRHYLRRIRVPWPGIVLVIAVILTAAIVIIKPLPNPLQRQALPTFTPDTFGIAVATFTEGVPPDIRETSLSREISALFYDQLRLQLKETGLDPRVKLLEVPPIKNEQAARELGESLNASLVIWGWIPAGTKNAFVPNFTVTRSPALANIMPTILLDAWITGLETIQLSEQLASKSTIIAQFVIGLTYAFQDDPDNALIELSSAINKAEESKVDFAEGSSEQLNFFKGLATLYLFRGSAYATLGQLDLAEADYLQSAELDPTYARPHIGLGNLHYSRLFSSDRYGYYTYYSMIEDAKREYEKAKELDPGLAAAYYGLGNLEFVQGNFEASLEMYWRSIELAERSGEPPGLGYYLSGLAYYALGDLKSAEEMFVRVKEVTRQGQIGLFQLAEEQLQYLTRQIVLVPMPTEPPPATSVPVPTLASPVLQSPSDGEVYIAWVPLKWEWTRDLDDEEQFYLRIWPAGQPNEDMTRYSKESERRINLVREEEGWYRWAVAVVRGVEMISQESTPGFFYFYPAPAVRPPPTPETTPTPRPVDTVTP